MGCAKGESTDDDPGGTPKGDAGRDVTVSLPQPDGTAPPPVDGGGGGQDATACDGKVVINELMAQGASGAAEEFVELYNPTGCAVSLAGWKLAYRSSSNSAGPDLFGFPAGSSIAAQGYLLLGSASFRGTKDATMQDGMAKGGGQIGLLDDNQKLVDGVGWGNASGAYTEGSAAPAPADGASIGRKTDGVDTGSNSADFKAISSPTPRAPN